MRWTDDELRELVALWPTNSAKKNAIRMRRPPYAILCRFFVIKVMSEPGFIQ